LYASGATTESIGTSNTNQTTTTLYPTDCATDNQYNVVQNENTLRIQSVKEACTCNNDYNLATNNDDYSELDSGSDIKRDNNDTSWLLLKEKMLQEIQETRSIDSDNNTNSTNGIISRTNTYKGTHIDSHSCSNDDNNSYCTLHSPDYSPNSATDTAEAVKQHDMLQEQKPHQLQQIDDKLSGESDKLHSIVRVLLSKCDKLTTSSKARASVSGINQIACNATHCRRTNQPRQQLKLRKKAPIKAATSVTAPVDRIYGRDWKQVCYLNPGLAKHYVPDEHYKQEPLISLISVTDGENDRVDGSLLLQPDIESMVIVDDGCNNEAVVDDFAGGSDGGGSSVGSSVVVCSDEKVMQDTIASSSNSSEVLYSTTLSTVFSNTTSSAAVNEVRNVLTPSTRIDVKSANKTPLPFTPTVRRYHQYVIRFNDITQMCDKCFYPDCVCFAEMEQKMIEY